jgi:hypothetical protein
MNALVKVLSGDFDIVGQIDDDKIEQIAQILGIAEKEKAKLRGAKGFIVVRLPEKDPKGTV